MSGPSSAPSDHTTLLAVLADYASAGYAGDLRTGDDGVHCGSCGTVTPAERMEIRSLRRLEGASDPADMAAVLATVCPACGTLGTLVVRFGPEASEAEGQLLRRSQDHRYTDDELPPAAGPSESGA